MSQTLFRQLNDIQLQAQKLTNGNPEEEELEAFSNYNNELKNYLLQTTDDSEVKQLIIEIPNLLEIEEENSKPLILLIILGLVTIGFSVVYLSYIAGMRRTRQIQTNIHTIRGKYASIEFLMKATS